MREVLNNIAKPKHYLINIIHRTDEKIYITRLCNDIFCCQICTNHLRIQGDLGFFSSNVTYTKK